MTRPPRRSSDFSLVHEATAPHDRDAEQPALDLTQANDQQLRAWVLDRYGSEDLADKPKLARRLYENFQEIKLRGRAAPAHRHVLGGREILALNERLRLAGLPELPVRPDGRSRV